MSQIQKHTYIAAEVFTQENTVVTHEAFQKYVHYINIVNLCYLHNL
jgi:hypothetical protein